MLSRGGCSIVIVDLNAFLYVNDHLIICSYVASSLKALLKGVQTRGQVVEDDLEDAVSLSLIICVQN